MSKNNNEGAVETVDATDDYGIIEAPNKFLDNVGANSVSGPSPVVLADGVLQRIKPEFEARFEADMRALKTLFVEMRDTGTYDLPLLVKKVHEIRGEAGTFGYNLVSEIGRMLCEFLPSIDQVGSTEQMAIAAHLQAMQTVVADKVKGDGPEIAKQIIVGLKMIMGSSKE